MNQQDKTAAIQNATGFGSPSALTFPYVLADGRTVGKVEKIEFTSGGAGNQFTTISGTRYATWWDVCTKDWKSGDIVAFHARRAPLWSGHPPILQATIIRKYEVSSEHNDALPLDWLKDHSFESDLRRNVMLFRNLPLAAKLALVHRLGECGELPDELTNGLSQEPAQARVCAALGDVPTAYVEVPADEVKSVFDARLDSTQGSHDGTWDSYHRWYLSLGDVPEYAQEDRWPVLSWADDEVFEDGWHRLHSYMRSNHPNIPVYSFDRAAATLALARLSSQQDAQARLANNCAEQYALVRMDHHQFDAMIAGLRLLEREMERGNVAANDGDVGEILTDGGRHEGLTVEEISSFGDELLTGDDLITWTDEPRALN